MANKIVMLSNQEEEKELIKNQLIAAGYTVHIVTNYNGLKQKLMTVAPNIVILDCEKFDKKTFQLLKQHPEDIPTLVLTEKNIEIQNENFVQLEKPYTTNELLHSIKISVEEKRKPKMLIIDNSSVILSMINNGLKNYDIYSATTPSKGLEILDSHKFFDIIVTDIELEEMDGFDFIREIKKRPSAQDIPILLLTADTKDDTVIKAQKIGVMGVINKPVNFLLLDKCVSNCIKAMRRRSLKRTS